MNDIKQERLAKTILGIFREIWCSSTSIKEPFNCSKCEFVKGEKCLVKIFIKNEKCESRQNTAKCLKGE